MSEEKTKDTKAKKPKEKPVKKKAAEEGEKRKRFPWGLIVLLVIVLAIVGTIIYINSDVHGELSTYRGTLINERYCFYDEKNDRIIEYSLSRGPSVLENTDKNFAATKAKLKPANTSADKTKYLDEVSKAMGSAFNSASYSYIDEDEEYVLFSYPSNGKPALWVYDIKRGSLDVMLTGANIKGIAYGAGMIYARDTDRNETLCYRVSRSYSGTLISVMPVQTVTSKPLSFWYMTMLDFAKGLIKGLKASRASS